MLALAADENFNNDIIRGLFRRNRELDIVRVQDEDVGLRGAPDPAVLAFCAEQGRMLLSHDVSTITRYAYDRVRAGKAMPGVIEVQQSLPIGRAIEEILLLVEGSMPSEWEGQVLYLPL